MRGNGITDAHSSRKMLLSREAARPQISSILGNLRQYSDDIRYLTIAGGPRLRANICWGPKRMAEAKYSGQYGLAGWMRILSGITKWGCAFLDWGGIQEDETN